MTDERTNGGEPEARSELRRRERGEQRADRLRELREKYRTPVAETTEEDAGAAGSELVDSVEPATSDTRDADVSADIDANVDYETVDTGAVEDAAATDDIAEAAGATDDPDATTLDAVSEDMVSEGGPLSKDEQIAADKIAADSEANGVENDATAVLDEVNPNTESLWLNLDMSQDDSTTGELSSTDEGEDATKVTREKSPTAGFSLNDETLVEKKRRRRRARRIGAITAGVAGVAAVVTTLFLVNMPERLSVPTAAAEVADDTTAQTECDAFIKAGYADCITLWKTSDTVERGHLIKQTPEVGASDVGVGSKATLVYSSGPESAEMPEVANRPVEEVQDELYKLGFTVTEINVVDAPGMEKDVVVDASSKPGAVLQNGASIILDVSSGAIELPDWKGKTRDSVQADADSIGVEVTFVEEESDETPGTVLSQTPKAGEVYSTGGVEVVLAKPFEVVELEVPDVVGMSPEKAQSELASVGFRQISTVVVSSGEVTERQVTQVVPGVGSTASSDESIVLIVSEPAQDETIEEPAA